MIQADHGFTLGEITQKDSLKDINIIIQKVLAMDLRHFLLFGHDIILKSISGWG